MSTIAVNAITNASGVSQIDVLSQSGTGTVSIVPPATNTNRTITLPDAPASASVPVASASDVQIFNSSGTWTKPSFGSMARIQVWGGGGGGGRNANASAYSSGGGIGDTWDGEKLNRSPVDTIPVENQPTTTGTQTL